MFVPQSLPLYAIVEGDSQVYQVVGWKATDTRWFPFLVMPGGLNTDPFWMFGASKPDAVRCAFYTTRTQAESALLAQ